MLMEKIVKHSGVAHDDNPPGRGSGRYAYGSGENPHQHQYDLISRIDEMKNSGIKEAEIAKILFGDRATVNDLKAEIAIAKNRKKKSEIARAYDLYQKYGNYSKVGREMGKSESSIRSLLDPALSESRDKYSNTAEQLKKIVDKKGMIDVSKYSELHLGVTQNTKDIAVRMLEKEGYVRAKVKIPQVGTNNETTMIVLAPPGTTYSDIQKNKFNVQPIVDFSPDQGKTFWTPEFPQSIDSDRIYVRYGDKGGVEKDGLIELRRGVEDLSLGNSQYAQVRIAVDGTHYMKGMAVYGEVPEGYDVVYNTNKKTGVPIINKDVYYDYDIHDYTGGKEVLKRMKMDERTGEIDKDNPFGALIKSPKEVDGVIMAGGQSHYTDKNGKEKLSAINKLQEEGDWDSWSRNLSSQFLSKQPLKLIKQQMNISIEQKKAELDEINTLTNPVIKKKMLEDYARDCESNAVDLSVAGFKRQAFQVLLPMPDLKNNEVYAPNYDDGDEVALIRYPHGGIFEIPIVRVNNKHKNAPVGKDAADAIGVNPYVLETLSGADTDGDTALVIPTKSNGIRIINSERLPGLVGFDPKELYKLPDDAPKIKGQTKQTQMGIVTNLITDMTVGDAGFSEIERAVKHSMVVIDSEKHHLDYKQSAIDNGIDELKRKYQGTNPKTGLPSGASTILSKSSSEVYVPKRKLVTRTSDMTPDELERWNEGKEVWRNTGETKKVKITDPSIMTPDELKIFNSGKKVYRMTDELKTEKVYRMDLVDDAMDLVRNKNNPKEVAYANYANELKSLANEARKLARSIKPTPMSKNAKETYSKEVEELDSALRIAEMNNPKERIAQALANQLLSIKLESNPSMDFEHKQRAAAIALNQARAVVGAKKDRINITDKQWEAIQNGAISTSKLIRIVNNSDLDKLKQRATPRYNGSDLTNAQINLIRSMKASGLYTNKVIADRLGISVSTVSKWS